MAWITIAGAVISAISAYQQGQAGKAAANYNAVVAEQNANASRQQAAMQATQIERDKALRLGSIRAAQAASGGTMAGSALDVIGDTASQYELQRQDAIYRGELQARGYMNTAQLDRANASASARRGTMAAGASLLQGAGTFYNTPRSTQPPAPVEDRYPTLTRLG